MEGKLPYVIGAAAALVGSALLYYYVSGMDNEEEEKYAELYSELEELKEIKKDASGLVVLDDFLKIFKLVTKHSKHQISKFKTSIVEQRRKFLKDGDEEGYKDCVKKQLTQEETIYQDVATEVLNHFKIDEQEFMMSQNQHSINPRFQKVMMDMQLGGDEGDHSKPSFSKEKAKEIFFFVEDEKEKAMANMKADGGMGSMGGMMSGHQDPEATISMIVEHYKVGDRLFEKYGVEEEEFAKSIQHYNLIQDPDIQKLMQKSMANLGPEAMQMLAQMQGGAPGGQMPGPMGF